MKGPYTTESERIGVETVDGKQQTHDHAEYSFDSKNSVFRVWQDDDQFVFPLANITRIWIE